ncbi:MAG TPA: peptidoglycan-binding protein [Candidatus Omnitrophota bacterium]|nr:peptidoglycan-binding protein [Candidatus Omnitrophota bacterium]HNQ50743.1 peptidoglycan-binding protein [Candidatus Omnitrophota bacterium]HQO37851.1 peptidoglycan-binding protein [Candidatus Omnitrophota bacterium]
MKLISVGRLLVVGCAAVSLAGCATLRKKENPETAALKSQVSDLQGQVQQKDAEIDSLRKALSRTTEERYAISRQESKVTESSAVPSATQIQTALCNAGYTIEIDGKLGKQTRSAIRDFQKANGLTVDGKVGKKTWAQLEPFLNKQ